MFGRLMPREGRFFDYFGELADHIVNASHELSALMQTFENPEHRARNIETIEKRGDKITHATIELLHKTFITPIDRDDIHKLVSRLDDILDLIEDAAQSIFQFDMHSISEEGKKLSDLCVACAEKVKSAVTLLHDTGNFKTILEICDEIDKLESEADHVMRSGMAKLFRDEPDVRQLIKLRAIYLLLEDVTDRCEDVADIIEGIVLENA
jgi:predicted phosphate transport protein (TIGR00153 family)